MLRPITFSVCWSVDLNWTVFVCSYMYVVDHMYTELRLAPGLPELSNRVRRGVSVVGWHGENIMVICE
jgi:hypothetical protein